MGLTVGLGASPGGGSKKKSVLDSDIISITTFKVEVSDKKITEFPLLDTSKVNDMGSMFSICNGLKTIPLIDTSNVTNMSSMFYNCHSLESIPLLNTSKVTKMSGMFEICQVLKTIPQLDTSNVTDMSRMFYNCYKLESVPLLNFSKCQSMSYIFWNCTSLRTVPLIDVSKVSSLGGAFYKCSALESCLINGLKLELQLNYSPNLSKASVLYIFENAQTITTAKTITLHADVFNQLTADEIAIATQKGFSVLST